MACILVIDDVGGVRKSIAAYLKRSGHEVLEAENGSAGLRLADEKRPDLVVTDMLMPELDGVEVIERLRANPRNRGVRILAVSGGGSLVPAKEALAVAERTADAVLRKPFENVELTAAVDGLLGRN
jgi:two-component system chemotaxis response regulator CheY